MPPDLSCALDVADDGSKTLEELGAFMNVSRERIRQLEEKAFKRIRRNLTPLEAREFVEALREMDARKPSPFELLQQEAESPGGIGKTGVGGEWKVHNFQGLNMYEQHEVDRIVNETWAEMSAGLPLRAALALAYEPFDGEEAYPAVRTEEERPRASSAAAEDVDPDATADAEEVELAASDEEGRPTFERARLDADGTAKGKTILTGRLRQSSSGEGTVFVGPGEFHVDTETGKRTPLADGTRVPSGDRPIDQVADLLLEALERPEPEEPRHPPAEREPKMGVITEEGKSIRAKILGALEGGPLSRNAIASATGIGFDQIGVYLTALKKTKEIVLTGTRSSAVWSKRGDKRQATIPPPKEESIAQVRRKKTAAQRVGAQTSKAIRGHIKAVAKRARVAPAGFAGEDLDIVAALRRKREKALADAEKFADAIRALGADVDG